MSLPEPQLLYTAGEYLAAERDAFERHEWLDGIIYAMAGESPEHSLICSNANASLNLQLRGKPCAVYSPNMKVYSRLTSNLGTEGSVLIPGHHRSLRRGAVSRRGSRRDYQPSGGDRRAIADHRAL